MAFFHVLSSVESQKCLLKCHCSEKTWETSGSDIPGDCHASGQDVGSPWERPGEG